jgi:hypothetical protein
MRSAQTLHRAASAEKKSTVQPAQIGAPGSIAHTTQRRHKRPVLTTLGTMQAA